MNAKWRGRLIWLIVALGLAAGLAYIFVPPPVPVDTATIARGPLQASVDDEGVTAIRELYTVSAPIAGTVLRSPVEIGDEVVKGKTRVATIKPVAPAFLDIRSRRVARATIHAAEAALKLAKATLAQTEAELEFARSDLDRAERLVTRGAVSERTRDQARLKVKTLTAALDKARADVAVREQELERARAQLIEPTHTDSIAPSEEEAIVHVLAPESGRVLKIMAESQAVVAPGAPILEIGDPRNLEIVVDLLTTDAVQIKPGDSAIIERWGGGRDLTARVNYIEPAGFEKTSALGIEEQRVKVHLDFTGAPALWQRLGHDYRVFVRVITWESKDVLRLPLAALFRKGTDWAVFKVVDGVARLQLVKLGHRNQDDAEIVDGLAAGERVILHPSDQISDGTKIIERAELGRQ